jgi:hypothetical protein
MSNIRFHKEFLENFKVYNINKEKIEELTDVNKKIKEQIDKWMEINDLKTYEFELDGTIFTLDYQTKKSNSVSDWEKLKDFLQKNQLSTLVTEKESDPFLVIRSKKKSK